MFYYQGRACETERLEDNDILFKLEAQQIKNALDIGSL